MTKPILVTGYVDPDLDGTASAIAYAEYLRKSGKDSVAGIIGKSFIEARYILERFDIENTLTLENAEQYDSVVLVDASETNGLKGKIDPQKVVEIVDHRKVHETDEFPNAKSVQIELVGTAATLIAEKFIESDVSISRESAILLYGAIISNTLNFKAKVTTQRDHDAAQWLNKTANLGDNFWRELFEAKSDLSGSKLEETLRAECAVFEIGEKTISIAQIEMIGAQRLVDERKDEIIEILKDIRVQDAQDYIFLSIIDLEESANYLVAYDEDSRNLIENVLEVKFSDNLAHRGKVIMRKEIVPLIKNELE